MSKGSANCNYVRDEHHGAELWGSVGLGWVGLVVGWRSHLGETVVMREKEGKDGADSEKVLDFEGIQVGVVGWFEVV